MLVLVSAPVLSLAAAEPPKPAPPASPLSPAEALKHFQLDPACRIELVAAEPEVVSPVDVRFDEDGRMWVVEMRDYPHGPAKGEPGTCRIKVLEDRDGDGRYETATVFSDKLLFATGIQPWRGGVFVTLAGHVAYMKDTNGDGRADIDETWFTGFAQENSQLRANHPRLALDNHIYVANGLRGGKIVNVRKKKEAEGGTSLSKDAKGVAKTADAKDVIDISGMDFRFDPLTGEAEAVSGNGQFGLTFDDYGNRFVCSNRNPLRHVVLEQRYLKQNPLVAVPDVCQDVAKPAEQSRVFPISRAWTTSNLHAGQFTAACGVEIYRGDALPKEFYGNAFTCEPTGNLVHREIMKPAGATFTSEPAYKDREFLASTDEWFRPVNLTLGPDGALYVVDMYRAVIEHPEFMPDELKKRPDLLAGNDRGRIWRVVGKDFKRQIGRFQMSKTKSVDLLNLFDFPNAWFRETAQRLIVEREFDRHDKTMVEALEKVRGNWFGWPQIHTLWTLRGLRSLDVEDLPKYLFDANPRVREQALVLAEQHLDDRSVRARAEADLALASMRMDNCDERLHYQAILTMSFAPGTNYWSKTESPSRLADFDVWARRATAISAKDEALALLARYVDNQRRTWAKVPATETQLALATELAHGAKRAGEPNEFANVLRALAALPSDKRSLAIQVSVLLSLAQTANRQSATLTRQVENLSDQELKTNIRSILRRSRDVAAADGSDERTRLSAIDLLAYFDASDTLVQIAQGKASLAIRLRAITSLSRQADLKPWATLLAGFARESPPVRRAIVEGALSRPDRTALLLDELSANRIKPAELDRAPVDRLLKHSDAKIRERAAKVLAEAVPADRQKVLAEYQVVLKMAGDARRGGETFKKNCATCHRIGEMGVNVAPDISDSRVKTPAQLLTDILQPNRAIDANYVSYSLLTTDGRQLTGIIAAETATSVTLRQQEGKTTTLLRSEIEKLQSNGISLMPEGLEKTIPPQEMADVIAFIKNWRYLDGRTPLGH